MHIGDNIKYILKRKNISQADLARGLGKPPQYVTALLKRKMPHDDTLSSVANFLKISVEELSNVVNPNMRTNKQHNTQNHIHLGENEVKYIPNAGIKHLPFVSVSARAGFIENINEGVLYPLETFPCLILPGENLDGQIVFEVDGDSMEPNYTTKMKVRAKQVDINDWAYLASGVYIFNYRYNFVTLKRVKNNDILGKGSLTLHSDNLETGGTLILPKNEINHIWKVLRIVDAPAR